MSEPLTPWRDGVRSPDAHEQRAAQVVQQTHELGPRPVDLGAGWDQVLSRATARRTSPMTLVLAGALSMLVGVWATGALLKTREPDVVAATGTQWERRTDGAVQLQAGRLQTSRATTVRVESPQVTISALACRFAAEVISEGTRVTVYEGTAVVRSGDGVERTLGPGESALWPAAPVISPALSVQSAPNVTCTDVACFERLARGDGLDAEVALFELGRQRAQAGDVARAVALWRESLTRFPGGVFDPEVRLSLLVTLTRQRQLGEALEAAREFEARQPDDPRLDDVRALRRQLEWLTTRR
jgi:hypothetical protein